MAEESAPYQALYRRFRPQRFEEVLGQDHVTRALRTAVREGRVAHAYLFSGPRGTGKTSTARILAMALNCESPEDGEPDGSCESCVAIRQGSSLDVQELDAASNRGIDEVRDLLSRVALGSPGRWKVYIVDEVHQMTGAASSALLKTLEEPPGHVIFVLATTDPQKVLDTIRSRTQHFEFHLLPAETLSELVRDVAKRAELDLPLEAVDVAVRRGHGSARDTLSVLDQVAAAGDVTDEAPAAGEIVDAICEPDAARVLMQVAESVQRGFDARRLATDVLEYLRNAFLATRAPSLVMLGEQAAREAEERARRMGPATLVRAMEVIGQAIVDMRDAADARMTLEVAFVRLADPEVDDGRAALLARIERLEAALDQRGIQAPREPPAAQTATEGHGAGATEGHGAAGPKAALGAHRRPAPATAPPSLPPPSPLPSDPVAPKPASRSPEAREPNAQDERGAFPTRDELTLAWGDKILPGLRPAVKVYVASGRFVSAGGDGAVYAVPDRGLLARAETVAPELEEALATHFGRRVPLKLVLDDPKAPEPVAVAEDPSHYDLTELSDAPGAVPPEQRLMEAFPGAEEVS